MKTSDAADHLIAVALASEVQPGDRIHVIKVGREHVAALDSAPGERQRIGQDLNNHFGRLGISRVVFAGDDLRCEVPITCPSHQSIGPEKRIR